MPEKILRSGITTGTCAAAAAKAAVLAWLGQPADTVEVTLPRGSSITVPVAANWATDGGGGASVVKDAGDDPDITNGVTITVTVVVTPANEIVIKAGPGVGTVTKPGLAVPPGEPAVNPVPRRMIVLAAREVLPAGHGAEITIAIPDGERLARRTLNPSLGIIGGLSIIGTTGIVEPMSEEAFKSSLAPQISVVKSLGYERIVFVPGKIGQDIAVKRYGLPADAVVQTSNFVGYMLERAVDYGIGEVLLFGHLGKIAKVAAGVFHTHNRIADARLETLAAHAAAAGAPQQAVSLLLECTTTEAAMPIIERYGLTGIYGRIAERASVRAVRYVFGDLAVGTVIVSMTGEILGLDDAARKIGGCLGWNIESL
ncbi:MAG: cobalt-precorrin-5B (C(1))-methyltransferase CbiD [Negativicutes bacterium]|nr:cobalt-precorrin-5B (C(1))-methyltransferase CbiD [Negativicutes bacterium]